MKKNLAQVCRSLAVLSFLGLSATFSPGSDGIYGDGVGARSMGLGGADVAWASDPLGAMGVNPAGLATLTAPELNFGLLGGALSGDFNKSGISQGSLPDSPAALPEGAIAFPIPKTPVVLGLSCIPEATLRADWHYNDPPGGLNGTTTYGYQQDKSEILSLRLALGAAAKVTSNFLVGASFGAVYNQNILHAPYIFQNLQSGAPGNSAYDGAKTLLDLRTSGWGWNAQVGALFLVTPDLQFGASYESETVTHTSGDANGDPSTQFGQPPGTYAFHYDANVKNTFPQEVRFGSSWKFYPRWRLALEIDWIDWGDAFRNLPLSFSNGSNATVNSVLGQSFHESTPLNWNSEFVYRTGVEFNVTDSIVLRLGYCYGNSPVPDSTLTPVTAAILENTITAGIGYHHGRYAIDAAYQYDFPATQTIGASGLRAGEYSNSSIEVSAQTFALTTTVSF